ncbi:MAG: helix-turn-helix domain-containing protein [Nitrososphaerales archaeon]
MSGFGEKVRGYRKDWGITQKALAEAAGLTSTYFNRIEKGTRKIPRVETVLALVAALRLKPKEAEELVELAGYSAQVLQLGGGLAYDSPTIPGSPPDGICADLNRFHAVLAKIPRQSQQACIDALITFIESLTALKGQHTTVRDE